MDSKTVASNFLLHSTDIYLCVLKIGLPLQIAKSHIPSFLPAHSLEKGHNLNFSLYVAAYERMRQNEGALFVT